MNIALILSGGVGLRLGEKIPKQYIEVGNRPILSYCMETLSRHDQIDAIQIVADSAWHSKIIKNLEFYDLKKKFMGFSVPGENRQLSILHGLENIKDYASDSDLVLIHDAARPLLSGQMITECLDKAKGHDGVLPVLPMKDTVYVSRNGQTVSSLLERSQIFAGQAPEVFVLGKYYEANRQLSLDQILRINGSTEPAILGGMDIVMIPGDERNYKITTKSDLEKFKNRVEEMQH